MGSRWELIIKISRFLKNLFEGETIKTGDDSTVITNPQNVKIINNKYYYITPPYKEISQSPYLDEIIQEEFSPESEDHSIMFVKKESIEDALAYTRTSLMENQKKLIKEWKKFLPNRYIGALILAYRTINLEDELNEYCQHSTKKQEIEENLKRLRGKLYSPEFDYRRKIYNFCRSGYIEGYFGAILGQLWANNIYDAMEKFPLIFEGALKFFEPAIWVDYDMKEYDLLTELRKRLKQDRTVLITIYARGKDRITMVENYINYLFDKWMKHELDFNIFPQNKESYLIGCTPAASFTVTNKLIKLD